MPGYIRFIYVLCLLAVFCAGCSDKKPAGETAPDAQALAGGDPVNTQAAPEPQTPLYYQGAQVMAQPGVVPQILKSMPIVKASLRPADAGQNPAALSDDKAETSYQLRVDRSRNPTIIYDLGPLADARPLYGVFINVKNAAEEGRKPIDYRPFMLSIKFIVSDGVEAPAPKAVETPTPEVAKADGDGEAARPAPVLPPKAEEIAAAIDGGAYLALLKIEWRSLNGEQVVLFDRPFEFKGDKTSRLLAEIDYIFGEEDTRFLDIAELNLLTTKSGPGVSEPLAVDKLAVPAIAGCYRNKEGKRIDIYASGLMRMAAPGSADSAPNPSDATNKSPQGSAPLPEPASDDKFGSWRVLNERLLFNAGGNGEMSCAVPGSGPLDFTPEFTAMQRDPSCSDPWGDISAELAAANLGTKNDITSVWQSDCDGDRRAELVVYLKDKKKAVILRHTSDWEAYSLWREMELSGDFRLFSDPVSGNCMLCEKDEIDGGWWINIYLSNNWYRSRRLTLPGE